MGKGTVLHSLAKQQDLLSQDPGKQSFHYEQAVTAQLYAQGKDGQKEIARCRKLKQWPEKGIYSKEAAANTSALRFRKPVFKAQ